MRLTARQKKLWHSVVIGFVTGALTALQASLLTPGGLTEKKALIAAAIGVVAGGIARALGAVLAWIDTAETAP
jgi:purine-cytosine permease-like protein